MNNVLFLPGAVHICAVSGGADSVFLLHAMREAGLAVHAAHFNHRLRGAESDRDEAFVRSLCDKWQIPLTVQSADVAAWARAHSMGIEEAARSLRYDFLRHLADTLPAGRIATAHTADDNAETMLLALSRGCGLRGLCGIPERRGNIIRPLLDVSHEEILLYLQQHDIPHVEDSSNADVRYSRNRLRRDAVPVLRSVNGRFAQHCTDTARLLREDELYLTAQAEEFIRAGGGLDNVSAKAVAALPFSIGSRVLRILFDSALQRKHVLSLLQAAGAGNGAVSLPGGTIRVRRDRFVCAGPDTPKEPEQPLVPGEVVDGAGYVVSCDLLPSMPKIHNLLNTFYLSHEKINGRLLVGPRRDGDAIRLDGRGCTKTLKKLFYEAGISPADRDGIPVLRDDSGPLAVCGFGVAERAAAREGDTVVYRISILQKEFL